MITLPLPLGALSIPAFVAGVVAAGVSVAWVLSLRRRGRLCPHCGATTVALVPGFPLRLLTRRLVRRWCAGCGWKGWALRPAHEGRDLRGKVRLNRGFRWGAQPPPPRGHFHWNRQESTSPDLPDEPASGEGEAHSALPATDPPFLFRGQHPSSDQVGFNWGAGPPSPTDPFSPREEEETRPGEVPSPPPLPFHFAEEEGEIRPREVPPPPPIPFRFAPPGEDGHGEGTDSAEGGGAFKPLIPFRFARKGQEGKPGEEAPPGPVTPRLGFRWKG